MQKLIFMHMYTGNYYTGMGGRGCILNVKNDSSFSLTSVYWTPNNLDKGTIFNGTYSIEYGSIRLTLDNASGNDILCFVPRLILVEWQGQKYLFPYDNNVYAERTIWVRDTFCERVKNETELEKEKSGTFLAFIDIKDKDQLQLNISASDYPTTFGILPFCQKEIFYML